MKTDTDPNNMLPETADVRVSNLEVEQIFGLHKDMMAVGVVNDSGIFNPETVNRMARLTEEIRGAYAIHNGRVFHHLNGGLKCHQSRL
ncbi:MAG: hypothetical protein ACYDGS_09920 [Thermoleophilia bacterium]